MKTEFTLFGRTFKFYFYTHKELNYYVAGITNKCKDGRYVIFLDYDNIPKEWVIEELTYLLDAHQLYCFDIFETNKGFHAISTEKVNLNTLVAIMKDTSTDAAYLSVPLRRARKLWTLRVTPKGKPIKHIGCVKNNLFKRLRTHSKPHRKLLEKLYNVPCPSKIRLDNEQEFWTGHYYIEG